VFPLFLVVVFSFLSAYLHVCVLWATLPELNKMNELNELDVAQKDRMIKTDKVKRLQYTHSLE